MSNLSLDLIERALRAMTPRSRLYAIVKAEMIRRGRWKAKPRGKGFAPNDDPRRNTPPKKSDNKQAPS